MFSMCLVIQPQLPGNPAVARLYARGCPDDDLRRQECGEERPRPRRPGAPRRLQSLAHGPSRSGGLEVNPSADLSAVENKWLFNNRLEEIAWSFLTRQFHVDDDGTGSSFLRPLGGVGEGEAYAEHHVDVCHRS